MGAYARISWLHHKIVSSHYPNAITLARYFEISHRQAQRDIEWGVDTGEFGIVAGYDDEDRIFHVSGIGSLEGAYSNPVLYSNIGRTFQKLPIMYCQYPLSYSPRQPVSIWKDSIQYYIDSMKSSRIKGNYAVGLAAYDHWINALEREYRSFGLRYITGVYAERKRHGAAYIHSIQLDSNALPLWAESYEQLKDIFIRMQVDILEQGFDGWNHLHKPVKSSQAKLMNALLEEAKQWEMKAVGWARFA